MSDRRCEYCEYFDLSTTSRNGERATCRIRPPEADAKTEFGVWPKVEFDDWCGAFRKRPEESRILNDDDVPF
jgi:hypothetical protein